MCPGRWPSASCCSTVSSRKSATCSSSPFSRRSSASCGLDKARAGHGKRGRRGSRPPARPGLHGSTAGAAAAARAPAAPHCTNPCAAPLPAAPASSRAGRCRSSATARTAAAARIVRGSVLSLTSLRRSTAAGTCRQLLPELAFQAWRATRRRPATHRDVVVHVHQDDRRVRESGKKPEMNRRCRPGGQEAQTGGPSRPAPP